VKIRPGLPIEDMPVKTTNPRRLNLERIIKSARSRSRDVSANVSARDDRNLEGLGLGRSRIMSNRDRPPTERNRNGPPTERQSVLATARSRLDHDRKVKLEIESMVCKEKMGYLDKKYLNVMEACNRVEQ
jgi:hypothetical protein